MGTRLLLEKFKQPLSLGAAQRLCLRACIAALRQPQLTSRRHRRACASDAIDGWLHPSPTN